MKTCPTAVEFEPGGVHFQVKATDQLQRLADGKSISWPVSVRDLKLWLRETYPVILAIYDGQNNRAYWIHVQAYIAELPTAELFAGRETISIRIPISNRLNPNSLRAIARYKNDLQQRLREQGPRHA